MAYLRYSFDDECVCVCVLLWRSSVDRRLKSMWTRYQSLYMWDVSDCAFFLDFFLRSLLCLIELYCCCIVSIELNSVLEFAFTPDPHDMHSLFGANAPNSLLMTMTMIFETHTPKTYIFVFTRLCCVFNLSQATIVLLLGFSVFAQFILFQIFFSFFLFFFSPAISNSRARYQNFSSYFFLSLNFIHIYWALHPWCIRTHESHTHKLLLIKANSCPSCLVGFEQNTPIPNECKTLKNWFSQFRTKFNHSEKNPNCRDTHAQQTTTTKKETIKMEALNRRLIEKRQEKNLIESKLNMNIKWR